MSFISRCNGVGAAALLALTVLTGCGSASSDGDATGRSSEASATESHSSHSESAEPSKSAPAETKESEAPKAAPVRITIAEFAYKVSGMVAPGARVEVTNDDAEAHTVTARNGAFNVSILPGETARFTAPRKPGSYPFYCLHHAGMESSLRVG